MSKAIYNRVCSCELSPAAKAVAKELAWFASDTGENAYPSVRTIASRTGYTRRAVQKQLITLEKLGLIQRVFRKGNSSVYRFGMNCALFNEQGGEHDSPPGENGATNGGEHGSPTGEHGSPTGANGTPEKGERGSPKQNEQYKRTLNGDGANVIHQALAVYGDVMLSQARSLHRECSARASDITPDEIVYFIHHKGRSLGANVRRPLAVLLRCVPDLVTPESVSTLRAAQQRQRERAEETERMRAQEEAVWARQEDIPRDQKLKAYLEEARKALAEPSRSSAERRTIEKMKLEWEQELRSLEAVGTSDGPPAASNARAAAAP